MSDHGSSGLDDIGAFRNVLGQTATEGVLLGMLVPIALLAAYNIVGRGLRGSVARIVTLTVVLVMLASSFILFATDLALFLLLSAQILSNRHDRPEPTIAQLLVVSRICTRLNYLIGDVIVAWRAWILSKNLVVRTCLGVLILVTFGCYLAETAIAIRAAFTEPDGNEPLMLTLIPLIPLLVTNAFSTSIIAYRTWSYRAQIKVHLQKQTRKNKVEQVLFLVVESGSLYCLLWIFGICFGLNLTYSTIPAQIVQIGGFTPYIACLFPITIILLVDRRKVVEDTIQESNHNHNNNNNNNNNTVRHSGIQFAPMSADSSRLSIIQSIADHLELRRSLAVATELTRRHPHRPGVVSGESTRVRLSDELNKPLYSPESPS